MKWVCRRCLTAFSSEDILNQHIDHCQKQQPTNITFSWKDHLKFEDYHMKVPVPIRVYADFECVNQPTDDRKAAVAIAPKVLFTYQIPIAVGFYLISPFGNCYYSYFGESCVTWFVNEILTLEKIASEYFKTNLPLEMTPEEEESFNNLPYAGFVNKHYAKIHSVIPKVLLMIKFEIMIILQASTEEQLTNRCNLDCKKSQVRLIPYFSIISVGMIVILYLKNS